MKSSVKFIPKIDRSSQVQNRRLALLVFAFAFGWYARTLAPGLLLGDPGEFQFAAWRFGLAHPTGYPLYLIVGGIWQRLLALFGVDPAFALNLLSAVFGAVTVSLFFLLLARWLPASGWGRLSALFGALLFALNPTFWSQSIIAEVYALNALLVVVVLWATVGSGGWTVDGGRWTKDGDVRMSPGHPLTPSAPTVTFELRFFVLAVLFGLAIGHHRTALFLTPGLLGWLSWRARGWWRRGRVWIALVGGVLAAQLVYLYIPLRSGPNASPWLYPRLNGEVLSLYTPGLAGFVDFITGRVFAVSFLNVDGALARLPQMTEFWLLHFNWTGLALIAIGLVALLAARAWPILLLTVPFALCLQLFNLFYGIGDIYVFYIPLYLMGALWASFGIFQLGRLFSGDSSGEETSQPITNARGRNLQLALQFVLFALLAYFVIFPLTGFYDDVNLAGNNVARRQWDAILAANPAEDAILVSNDRNEIVPLYYLQAVEGRAPQLTGIFPLLTPQQRFADVGEVVQTALDAGDRPVYLVKAMDGLGVRFDLSPVSAPLVQVMGPVTVPADSRVVESVYGPLTLRAVTLENAGDGSEVSLYWHVDAPLARDFTTTVQLFDAAGNKIAQNDQPAGTPYYPTSLWKVGDILRERHRISLVDGVEPVSMLIAMYWQPPPSEQTTPAWIYVAEPKMLEMRR